MQLSVKALASNVRGQALVQGTISKYKINLLCNTLLETLTLPNNVSLELGYVLIFINVIFLLQFLSHLWYVFYFNSSTPLY